MDPIVIIFFGTATLLFCIIRLKMQMMFGLLNAHSSQIGEFKCLTEKY